MMINKSVYDMTLPEVKEYMEYLKKTSKELRISILTSIIDEKQEMEMEEIKFEYPQVYFLFKEFKSEYKEIIFLSINELSKNTTLTPLCDIIKPIFTDAFESNRKISKNENIIIDDVFNVILSDIKNKKS